MRMRAKNLVVKMICFVAVCMSVTLFSDMRASAAEYTYTSGTLTYSYVEENGEGTLTIGGTGKITQKSYQEFKAYLKSQEYYDYVLTKLIIGEGITEVGKYFLSVEQETGLKEVVFSEGLKRIGTLAFSGCTSLESPKFPNSLTHIDHFAFDECTSITDVAFPSNLKYLGTQCFRDTGLKEITIPAPVVNYMGDNLGTIVSSELIETVTFETGTDLYIGGYIEGCPNIKKITVGNATYTYDPLTDTVNVEGKGTLVYANMGGGENTKGEYVANNKWSGAANVHISGFTEIESMLNLGKSAVSFDKSVKKIGTSFAGSYIKKVTIPKTLTSYSEGAFEICKYLEEVVFEEGTKKVAASMFLQDSALKKVTLADSITTIEKDAFRWCKSLKKITLPAKLKTIEENAFLQTSLTGLKIPAAASSLDPYAFVCTNIKKFEVDPSNKYYSAKSGVLFNKNMTKLICYPYGKTSTSYTIPATVKTVGEYAFVANKHLKSVKMTGVTTLKSRCFSIMEKIENISLGNKLEVIEEGVFLGDTTLKSLTIPETVCSLGELFFCVVEANCPLKYITIKSTKLTSANVAKDAFAGMQCDVKVPASRLSAYQKLFKAKGLEYKVLRY